MGGCSPASVLRRHSGCWTPTGAGACCPVGCRRRARCSARCSASTTRLNRHTQNVLQRPGPAHVSQTPPGLTSYNSLQRASLGTILYCKVPTTYRRVTTSWEGAAVGCRFPLHPSSAIRTGRCRRARVEIQSSPVPPLVATPSSVLLAFFHPEPYLPTYLSYTTSTFHHPSPT